MDELDLLKKDWKNREKDIPQFKANQLYKMILKKSSSIVKWIFIISLLELGFGILLNIFLMDDKFWNDVESIHLKTATICIYIANYLITFTFIVFFYKRYRTISTTDSTTQLMRNILKTRKIVKYYIFYVLISSGITAFIYYIYTFIYPPAEIKLDPATINWFKVIGIGIVVIVIFVAILWGIYSLLYGILLRKLKRNYHELKKLEL